jgi:uncharacterized protein (TIGR00297 family)
MSPEITRWLLAALAAVTIALLALKRRSLNASGALAAFAMGTMLVGAAGWFSGLLLVAFFLSSSILSHAGTNRTSTSQARGAERDAVQVLSNGGVALASAVLYGLTGTIGWLLVLAGSLAAANADTWSTEIGRTSRSLPRLITNWRQVSAGTSGAVSGRGLAGAAGGGLLIATLAAAGWRLGLMPGDVAPGAAAVAIAIGGLTGSLVDSFLGATLQDGRWCNRCKKETEQRIHRCGTPTRSVRGIAWIDNDAVNVTCVLTGGLAAWGLVLMVS